MFTIPAGTLIPARGFLVIAKNRTALLSVASYALNPGATLGDYTGQLDNAGGLLVLLNAAGGVVDSVGYDDRFPWPIAADALGASDNWLPPALLPLTAHQYRGVSLERVSYDLPANEVANWVPSPLDGATPGRANTVTGTPPAIVETLTAGPVNGQPLIRSSDEVIVRAGLSARGTPSDVRLEYFVDDLERTDEARTTVAMTGSGSNFDVRLPAQGQQQHRPLPHPGQRRRQPGRGLQVLSPRPSDPHAWHAYFVSPAIAASQPPYQLFVKATDWGQLWTNVNFSDTNDRRVVPESIGGTTVRCQPRVSWDGRVPAVFVVDGVVYDVRVRYQGSRWNRPNGNEIDLGRTTINPLPQPMMTRTSGGNTVNVLRALSWNISFPRFRRFEGQPRSADPEQAEPVLPRPGRRRRRRAVRRGRPAHQPGALPPPVRQRRLLRLRPRHRGAGRGHAQAHHPRRTAGGRPVQGLGQQRQRGRPLGPGRRPAPGPELRRPDADLRPAGALHRHLRAQDLGVEDRRGHPVADRRADHRPHRRQPERQQHGQRQPGPGAHVPGPELRHPADAGLHRHPQLVGAVGRLLPQLLPLQERRRPLVDGALGSGPGVRRELRLERPQVVLHRRAGRPRRPQQRVEPAQGRVHPRLPERAAGPAGLPGHRRPRQQRSRQGRAVAPALPGGGEHGGRASSTPPTGAPRRSPACATSTPRRPAWSGSATNGIPRWPTSWPAPPAAAA